MLVALQTKKWLSWRSRTVWALQLEPRTGLKALPFPLPPPAAVVEEEVPFLDVTEEADAARALAVRLVGDVAE